MGDREALARLIAPASWRMPEISGMWDAKQEIEDSLSAADRILAAGWRPPPEPQENEAARLRKIIALALAASDYGSIREVLWRGFDNGPPPEPQAADLPLLDAEARPVRFRLCVTETPPPELVAEPQALPFTTEQLIAAVQEHQRIMLEEVIPEIDAELRGQKAAKAWAILAAVVAGLPSDVSVLEPQAAASEVVERAVLDEARKYATMDVPPVPDQGEGWWWQTQMTFQRLARALLAEHARAEERDLYKASAMHHAERAEAAERRLYVVASAEMPAARLRAEAAEATVKRLRDDLASYGVHLAICQKSRFRDRVMICDCGLDAALTPAGGGDGR